MARTYKIPLVLHLQPEGGFTVTSPDLPELITEGDTIEEALDNVRDAFDVVLEIYEDQGREIPAHLLQDPREGAIFTEQLIAAS